MTRGALLKAVAVLVPAALLVGVLGSRPLQAETAPPDAGAPAAPAVPGEPQRSVAVSAVAAARNAVDQAGKDSPNREEAAAQLAQAEALLSDGKYREAATAADNAWRLVSGRTGEKTKFTVDVAPDGKTEVRATTGQAVQVEAQGVTEALYPGDAVVVAKGMPPRRASPPPPARAEPPPPARALPSPQPVAPGDKEQVLARAIKGGVGPVVLRWSAVPGATGYEVEVLPRSGKALKLKARGTVTAIAALPEGSYRWTVRAVEGSGALRSPPSAARSFELKSDGLKLEVKGTDWK